jgi:hypothetical protein
MCNVDNSLVAKWRDLFGCLGRPCSYQRNACVFSQGDECSVASLLTRGIVKLVYADHDGTVSILGLRYPGDLLGDWWQGLATVYPVSAIAIVPCEIESCCPLEMLNAERDNCIAAQFGLAPIFDTTS